MQFGIGIAVGLIAAVSNVYWYNTSGDSWYIQVSYEKETVL